MCLSYEVWPAYGGRLPRFARICLFQIHRVGLTPEIGFVSYDWPPPAAPAAMPASGHCRPCGNWLCFARLPLPSSLDTSHFGLETPLQIGFVLHNRPRQGPQACRRAPIPGQRGTNWLRFARSSSTAPVPRTSPQPAQPGIGFVWRACSCASGTFVLTPQMVSSWVGRPRPTSSSFASKNLDLLPEPPQIGFVSHDRCRQRHWQPRRPPVTAVRAQIGFVSPRPFADPTRHNSFSNKYLPFVSLQGKLASFCTLVAERRRSRSWQPAPRPVGRGKLGLFIQMTPPTE